MFKKIKEFVRQKIEKDEKRDCELRIEAIYEKPDSQLAYKQAGNKFDVKEVANDVKKALGNRIPIKICLGFNPVSESGEIVVFLKYWDPVFVPLRECLTICGAAWSSYKWLNLYFAQRNLSEFLENLGKELNIPVEDRCLYMDFLLSEPPIFEGHEQDELNDACMRAKPVFLEKYSKQIAERKTYKGFWNYHNEGFSYKYIPSIEINNAINAIYKREKELKDNNYWDETKKIIRQLMDIC